MNCPYCLHLFHDDWRESIVYQYPGEANSWHYRHTECPGCHQLTMELLHRNDANWRRVLPRGLGRPPVPSEVPPGIKKDYEEAAAVLALSVNASAALSRRCLQVVLREHGYNQGDVSKQIDAILSETDPLKAIPSSLRQTVDAIRNFGNFAAHAINDVTTLQLSARREIGGGTKTCVKVRHSRHPPPSAATPPRRPSPAPARARYSFGAPSPRSRRARPAN